jgi:HEAT repeat protein
MERADGESEDEELLDGYEEYEDDGGEVVLDVELAANLSYPDVDDARAEALLVANGVGSSDEDLIEAARTGDSVLRGAAVRLLGWRLLRESVPLLTDIGQREGDLLRAEAGLALVRLGVDVGSEILTSCLSAPVYASLGVPTAAGYLARTGDPQGFPLIRQALGESNLIIRIVAAKQLWYFVPFDGQSLPNGERIDVWDLYSIALADEQPGVSVAAQVQLEQLDDPKAADIARSAGVDRNYDRDGRNMARSEGFASGDSNPQPSAP